MINDCGVFDHKPVSYCYDLIKSSKRQSRADVMKEWCSFSCTYKQQCCLNEHILSRSAGERLPNVINEDGRKEIVRDCNCRK